MTELTTSQLNNNDTQQQLAGIRVVARIRPFLPQETPPDHLCIYKEDNYVCTSDPNNHLITTQHPFDKVYDQDANQCDVFQSLEPYIHNVLCGIPLLQINYGVTSSGKTFTLFGTPQNPGILAQSLNYLMQKLPTAQFYVSVVQIYLNQVTDLLNNGAQLKAYATQADPLPQRTHRQITNIQQLQDLIQTVDQLREKAATMNNSQSSRSHCLIFITLQHEGSQNQMCFVDLAGSEPFQAQGNRLLQQESSFIRTSLLMLDKAIRDLKNLTNTNQNSVSFRSSQLTMCLRQFLQPKLLKTGKYELPGAVFMILNLHGNPQSFYSNKETLNLGLLCKEIKNYAKTPSRLGQLGHSVQQLIKSVADSQVSQVEDEDTSLQKSAIGQSVISRSGVEQLLIRKQDWEAITGQFQYLSEQIAEIEQQAQEDLINERKQAVEEVAEAYELEIQNIRNEYEQELYEKDLEILELKRQLGLLK